MDDEPTRQQADVKAEGRNVAAGIGLAVALAAVAAVGAGIAVQQILERRLSRPEVARLKFYRYLREKGHLES